MPGERENVGALQFFRALYDGVGAGYIEIRPKEEESSEEARIDAAKRRRLFHWPSEVEAAVAYAKSLNGKFHVFFGVGLRRMNRKPAKQPNFQMGGKENIGCVTAAFADFDFKDVPEEELRRMLGAFRFRPSIVVKSGHGVHVYWLLDYPAMGEHLETLQEVNLGLLTRFRAQRGPQDYSRILRVPETQNIKEKYGPGKPTTEVTYLKAATRYKLADLRAELDSDIKRAIEKVGKKESFSSLSRPAAGAAPVENSLSTAAPPPVFNQPPPAPSGPAKELTPELMQKLSELLTGIWIDGHRHYLAMYVSGILAHSGYSAEAALRLIQAVCTLAGDMGELRDRELVVADTFSKHASGRPVAGGPMLEALVERFPGIVRERALKVCDIVRKSLPKKERESFDGRAPDFEILKVVKFDSRPARWCVTIKKSGDDKEHTVTCETQALVKFDQFQAATFEQTHIMLQEMKQPRWKALIGGAMVEVREAPPEAKPEGAIQATLTEFLEESREIIEPGMLRSFPGYDEETTYFRLDTFKRFLREKGHKIEDQVLFDNIKHLGWSSGLKRFGDKIQRLWIKSATGAPKNGNGHAHQKPAEPPKAAPEPEVDDLVFPGFGAPEVGP